MSKRQCHVYRGPAGRCFHADLYARTLKKAGVSMYKLPYGVERHTREADGMRYVFYLNDTTGPQSVSGVEGSDLLTGEVIKGILTLEPYGVACVKE